MSSLGMQMPGRQRVRPSGVNVYTGLMLGTVACLIGAIAFVLGAAILFDTDVPGIEISWAVIGGVAASSLILTLIIARLALRSTRSKVVSGREELIGAMAEVLDWKGQKGHVFVHGERWQATADQAMIPGQPVRVVALDGLTLKIDTQGAQETPTG